MRHELKADSTGFWAVWDGLRPYQIRKDDRGYAEGDELYIRETKYTGEEMTQGKPLEFTRAFILAKVKHILRGPVYGIQEGWAVLTIHIEEMGWENA